MKFVHLLKVVTSITFAGFIFCQCGCHTNLVAESEISQSQQEKKTDRKPMSLPKDTLPNDIELKKIPLGLPSDRSNPKDNPLTKDAVALGRKLFFDSKLSVDGTVSCATCHRPRTRICVT